MQNIQKETYNGFLYEIRNPNNEKKGYLLGTMHKLPILTDSFKLNKEVNNAISQSARVIIEYLREDIWETEFIDCETPIKVSLKENYEENENTPSVEWKLFKKANKKQIEFGDIEYFWEQLSTELIFKKMKQSEIARLGNEKYDEMYKQGLGRIQEAYRTSNSQFFKEFISSISKEAEELYENLFKRNVNMTTRMEYRLVKPGISFFAVGSNHLFGEKGMVSLLRDKGWVVKKVKNKPEI